MKNLFLFFTAFMLSLSAYTFAVDEACPEGQVMDPETGVCVPAPVTDDEATDDSDAAE